MLILLKMKSVKVKALSEREREFINVDITNLELNGGNIRVSGYCCRKTWKF